MVKFVDRVKLNLTTTGTGTVTFGTVVEGFQSLSDASVVDAETVRYTIESGTDYEVGTGTIGLAGGTYTMARSPSSSSESDNSAINVASNAQCFLTMLAEDVVQNLYELSDVSDTTPSGGQTLSWDLNTSTWSPTSPSGGIATASNYASLPSSPSETDLAWVQDTKSLYIYDGTEWDRFYTDTNATPDWDTPPPSEKQFLTKDGTATVQTVVASDPEGFPIEYTFDTNPTSPAQATVSNTLGVFTITPSTSVSDEGEFTLRYRASDGIHSTARSTVYNLAFYINPDITNASYDNKSFSFYNPERNAHTVRFNADGTRMYVVGTYYSRIWQYDLSTAWDVSTTASFSHSTTVYFTPSQESYPVGLAFSTDGTKMYMTGGVTDKVWEYDLSTGFDISTASYNGSNVSVSGTHSNPNDITFSNDGTKMFIVGASADYISQYNLTTGFDVTTATYSGNQISTGSTTPAEPSPYGLAWNNNGTKMYLVGSGVDTVHEYDLTTGFDLSTATLSGNTYLSSHDPRSICFSSDGEKMYLLSYTDDKVHQYSV